MAYPDQKERTYLAFKNHQLPESAGELNYLFTRLALQYVKAKGESYQVYNDVMGALEAAKHELYRCKIAEYENKKRAENGDVYPED